MSIYLVDFENVKANGLSGIEQLTEEDRVSIFYSENADTITFELHHRMNVSKAQIEFVKVEVGNKNALDFQLVTYLGYLIAQDKADYYYIVSNDRGFEYVKNFWSHREVKIVLVNNLCTRLVKMKTEVSIEDQIRKAIPEEELQNLIFTLLEEKKTKQEIHVALSQYYKDTKKTSERYQMLKPLMEEGKPKRKGFRKKK